jgi:hypothetical protein
MPRYTAPIVLALLALMVSAPVALAAPAHHRCHHHRHACRRSAHRRSSATSPNSVSSRAQPVTGAVTAAAAPEAEVPFDTDGSEPQPVLTLAELEALSAEGEPADVVEEVVVPG